MNPTPSDLHINVPLTNISIAYMQDANDFVADQVFPVVPVVKQSDVYYIYDRADWNRSQMKERGPATESAGGVYRVANAPYNCPVFALHRDVPDPLRANADGIFDLDAEASEFLSMQAMLKRELDFTNTYLKTGVWGTDVTGVASSPGGGQLLQWSDAQSTPIEDIRAAKLKIKQTTGLKAGTLVLGEPVWNSLVDHPDIIDRIKFGASPSSPAIVQRQAVASILELDRLLVMGATVNNNLEGQVVNTDFISGKTALLCHAATKPGLQTPTAGYTFAWRGYLGATETAAVYRFRMDAIRSDRVEIEMAYTQKVIGADLGYYFNGIVK